MCRGSMVCGKNVRSGSGKIGTKIWPTGPCASPDGGELEGRQAVEPLDNALGEAAERPGLGRVRLADRDGHALVAPLRVSISRGMRARRGTSNSPATFSPPPSPKMAYLAPVSGATK